MWHPGRRGSCCIEAGLLKEGCLRLSLAPTPSLNPELEKELGFAAPLSCLAELALCAAEDGKCPFEMPQAFLLPAALLSSWALSQNCTCRAGDITLLGGRSQRENRYHLGACDLQPLFLREP